MTDSEPPRVRVALPGGRGTGGRLHAWRQGPDGRWWAQVTIHVPAGSVAKMDGEDYASIPREPRYVLDSSLPPGPTGPRFVLHQLGVPCWALDSARDQRGVRITPVGDTTQARALLLINDTITCDICRPDPGLANDGSTDAP